MQRKGRRLDDRPRKMNNENDILRVCQSQINRKRVESFFNGRGDRRAQST
jgi:hypothetical protein